MKELTIEEKAKRYDEALERAKKLYNDGNSPVATTVEEIFSELKESEDERIRKELIAHFKTNSVSESWSGLNVKKVIAWLEKQGEQSLANKVEPKFHEGEWITNGDYTWKIVEVKPLDYILQSQEGNIVDDTISHVDEQFHSFTIKDAKDGDVLSTLDYILIFKEHLTKDGGVSYCHYDFTASNPQFIWLEDKNWYFGKEAKVYPATKEQRDQLEKAMADADYTFDFEKKELKKIEED